MATDSSTAPTTSTTSSSTAPSSTGSGTTANPPTSSGGTVDDQVAKGAKLYADNCASCHGADGTSKDDAALVGIKTGALPLNPNSGSGRTNKFQTAADIFTYAQANMPPKSAGGVMPDDASYYAVIAWIMKQNSIAMTAPLDATNAASINIH
jgi:mono/diheme cytochrome c family protein